MNETTSPPEYSLLVLDDDALLQVISYLNTAVSISSLSGTCKRLHRLIEDQGWREFIKARFSNLDLSGVNSQLRKKKLADALTWQARCWDRRSIDFAVDSRIGAHETQRQTQSIPFRPVLAAHMDHNTVRETLICGAGPDIQGHSMHNTDGLLSLHVKGADNKPPLLPGRDDITALSLVSEASGALAMAAVGRAKGQVDLLSASPNHAYLPFGQHLCRLETPNITSQNEDSTVASSWKNFVVSLDVLPQRHGRNLVCATTSEDVRFYDVPFHLDENSLAELPPVLSPSFSYLTKAVGTGTRVVDATKGAKFMGKDMLVTGGYNCLEYHSVTESTLRKVAAWKCKKQNGRPIPLQTFEPVTSSSTAGHGENFIISSWNDCIVRFKDIRTPNQQDALFSDGLHRDALITSLLPYGTTRFLAGNDQGFLNIFDLRWPRLYHPTDGLACAAGNIYPEPPSQENIYSDKARHVAACDYIKGTHCGFHDISRTEHSHPQVTIALNSRIAKRSTAGRGGKTLWSLTKSSDISPRFYAGQPGRVVQGTLEMSWDKREKPQTFSPIYSFAELGSSSRGTSTDREPFAGHLLVEIDRLSRRFKPFKDISIGFPHGDDQINLSVRRRLDAKWALY